MGKGGSSGGTQTTENNIAPELKPLFSQTAQTVEELQPGITAQFPEFFGTNVQQIPGPTNGQLSINDYYNNLAFNNPLNPGQQELANIYHARAYGNPLTAPQQDAYSSLTQLTNSPVGSSPATQAAIAAVREPVLNDLALAGLGNSGAIAPTLSGAYAPILAQEMQQRFSAIPLLGQLGQQAYAQNQNDLSQFQGLQNQAYQQQLQNLALYGGSQEQIRNLQETQGQAQQADLLRRQQLGQQFTLGVLGGFPSLSGSVTKSKASSGGGMLGK